MNSLKSNRLYMITVVWALMYPAMLHMFADYIGKYNSSSAFSAALGAAFIMAMLTALPIVSFWAVRRMNSDGDPKAHSKRALLYLLVATPPAYILVGTISSWFGYGTLQPILWLLLIILWFSFIQLGKATESSRKKAILDHNFVRKIHRISAFLLVFGFIGLHILNHMAAIISVERHEELRLLFRGWYASALVEPVFFGLLIVMVFTGVTMAQRYMRADSDLYKTLQIGSGLYMVFFFAAHVNAVLSARGRGVETDWIFATGEQGLINGYYFLIPYYIWSVGMIWMHVCCGIRMIMLGNKASMVKANQSFKTLLIIGTLVTVTVAAAVLGIQL